MLPSELTLPLIPLPEVAPAATYGPVVSVAKAIPFVVLNPDMDMFPLVSFRWLPTLSTTTKKSPSVEVVEVASSLRFNEIVGDPPSEEELPSSPLPVAMLAT